MLNPNEDELDRLDGMIISCIHMQRCQGMIYQNKCVCDEMDKVYTIGKRKVYLDLLERNGEVIRAIGSIAFVTPVAAKVWMKCVNRQLAIFRLDGTWQDNVKWDNAEMHYVTTADMKVIEEVE